LLFLKLKKGIKNDVIENAMRELLLIPKIQFERCFSALGRTAGTRIDLQGAYFERN